MAQTDLTHLDAYLKLLGQLLDQVTEIHAVIGRVVERCFGAVSLELYVREFHAKSCLLDDLAGTVHGGSFLLLHFAQFLQITLIGDAVDGADLLVVVYLFLEHLQAYEFTFQRYGADVMPVRYVYYHWVAGGQVESVYVAEEIFASSLESYFYDVELLKRGWYFHIAEPVEHV